MNLNNSIEDLMKGTKHYKLIIVNENAVNYVNECKKLESSDIKKINVSSILSQLLLDKSIKEKENEAWDILETYLNNLNRNILILYNVDYMFSPDLCNFDVVNTFKYYSRNGKIVVLFINGKLFNDRLIYSEEGMDDYKNMDVSEVTYKLGW